MPEGMYRIGIVGANSLLGKELADELQESLLAASDFLLFDDEEGQVTAVGDEPAVIQQVESGSFDRMDFVFFAGSAADTRAHWLAARKAGASIVDLADILEGERGVLVRAPMAADFLRAAGVTPTPLALDTPAVVAAHPAAVMLAMVAARIHAKLPIRSLAATIIEPASQHGRAAMDELHQQTVNLLSFQTLPKDEYDAQVAFNLLPSLGESAKVALAAAEQTIARHYGILAAGTLPALDLELIQAPVFHGYVASLLVELASETNLHALEAALEGEGIDVVSEDSDPPSNLSAAGQEDIMVRVKSTAAASPLTPARRFFLWLAADNLKLTALNAISCANELKRMRPRGKVQ
jgi:aspartate-semialdehyde dehydrogenase